MAGRVATPRERAREAALEELKTAARAQLAQVGAAALSVRLVARDVGMSSSGVYRYFKSRDELLTALIVDAYDALGAQVERAESAVDRDELMGRWRAACDAVRSWARRHPQEYGLVYGSPVPGYVAPAETVAPATRVAVVLSGILRDAWERGRTPAFPEPDDSVLDASLGADGSPLRGLPNGVVAAGLTAWSSLFGLVTFEVFGHLVGAVADHDAFFELATVRLAQGLGLADAP